MKEHILDRIITADGKYLVYYREYGSCPTDVKTRVEQWLMKYLNGGKTMAEFKRDTGKEAQLRRWFRNLEPEAKEYAFMYSMIYGKALLYSMAEEFNSMYSMVDKDE